MNIIDISTPEKQKEVYEIFNSFKSKSEIHKYYGISDNSKGCEYIKKIAEAIGFGFNTYKIVKPTCYCKQCGKEITSKWGKEFCSSSCAASYNNTRRDVKVNKSLEKSSKKDARQGKKGVKKRFCIVCGNELTGHQTKYCSEKCERESYPEHICLECGKTYKNKNTNSKFCSNECASKYRVDIQINKWLNGDLKLKDTCDLSLSIRRFLYERVNYKCEICGFEGYNKSTGNTILQLHHIDGDSTNNSIENIQVLCPNCHAMTDNFMGLNKGKSSRKNRYKKA